MQVKTKLTAEEFFGIYPEESRIELINRVKDSHRYLGRSSGSAKGTKGETKAIPLSSNSFFSLKKPAFMFSTLIITRVQERVSTT